MNTRETLRAVLVAGVLGAVASCGGALDSGGIGGSGFVAGPIEDLGSIVVEGIRFDVDDATITVNGQPATPDDLALGMMVSVSGTIDDTEGIAELVEFEDDLRGPVESIDLVGRSLQVLGQPVFVDDETAGIDLASLAEGDLVRVSGYAIEGDGVRATRLDRPGGNLVRVRALARAANEEERVFAIPPVVVDYADAIVIDDGGDGIQAGDLVAVEGALAPGKRRLTASRVRVLDPAGAARDGDVVVVTGIAASRVMDGSFALGLSRRVLLDPDTVIMGGTEDDIRAGVVVGVRGLIQSQRTRILADRVRIFGDRR